MSISPINSRIFTRINRTKIGMQEINIRSVVLVELFQPLSLMDQKQFKKFMMM